MPEIAQRRARRRAAGKHQIRTIIKTKIKVAGITTAKNCQSVLCLNCCGLLIGCGVSNLRNDEIACRIVAYVIYASIKFKFPDRPVNIGVAVFFVHFFYFNANNFNGFCASHSVTYKSVNAVNNQADARQTYQYKRYNISCHVDALKR